MAPTYAPDHLVAGRYRIVDLLGVGRTAEVYLAEDQSLNRQVVVKVLLADLAGHESVRRAFRDHIVRAATLSHPHVARVFDGGQEAGAIFMITEYLAGGSLEEVFGSGRRLSVNDGARLGRDVASALGYLEANGFVLGSLSPSKLLFDGDGRVRVSDVALAGLGEGLHERTALNDARYVSPEQVLGEPLSAKSDVYSLSLILFEAVTGSPAYEGATVGALLRARLDTPLPVRVELGTLDMILAQGAVPDPRLRLDAEQFSTRLGAVVGDNAPLVVRPGGDEVPLLTGFARGEPRESIGFRAPTPDVIAGPTTDPSTFARVSRGRPLEMSGPVHAPGALGRTPRFERPAYELDRPAPRRWVFGVAAVVIVVAAIAAGVLWKAGVFTSSGTVPDLVGQNYQQVTKSLVGTGYSATVTKRVHSAHVAADDVVSQNPTAGTSEKSGTVINVIVSEGPTLVLLPTTIVGESCAAATAQLTALFVNAQCPTRWSIYSSTTSINDVARVLYKGSVNPKTVPIHSSVLLSLSKGPTPAGTNSTTTTTSTTTTSTTTTTLAGEGARKVPNVVGDTMAETNTAMHRAGLYYTTTGPGAGTTTWTKVTAENPGAGTTVAWHSTVTLTVQ